MKGLVLSTWEHCACISKLQVTLTITKQIHFQLIGKARLECLISLSFVYERLRGMPRPGIELATFRSRVASANHWATAPHIDPEMCGDQLVINSDILHGVCFLLWISVGRYSLLPNSFMWYLSVEDCVTVLLHVAIIIIIIIQCVPKE